ncbi:RNA ligase [Candidatus Micrarchaeota archaeon]|nr:RNA ligase [Candidatus Micrarchaeota archaeon]
MKSKILRGIKKGRVEEINGELSYYRVNSPFEKIERGTVVIGDRVIWGYPHIKRIFTLEKGIQKNIALPVYAEEKIDGFNVRIASVRGRIYAFSRGGFLSLFVTEKARKMRLEKFFADNPGYVLCGEMIGNTPYTRPTGKFDVKLLIFDIDAGDGSYIEPGQRYGILRKYGIEGVPCFGKFEKINGLKKLMLDLNKGKKEGILLKNGREVIKYVTPFADIDDISKASKMLFDMPIGFFYQRVLRSSFSIVDFRLDRKKHAALLGEAFYSGLTEAVHAAKKGESISEEFEILIDTHKIWDDIMEHMSRDVHVEKIFERKEKNGIRIRFRKIYTATSKKLISYANGKGVTD